MAITYSDDLIDDRTLGEVALGKPIDATLDSLGHASLAKQIADIALASQGHVNIAVFGPWGSGKSSLADLIKQAFQKHKHHRTRVIVFDAWKSGGQDFAVNFLNEVGSDISKRRGKRVQRRLFESRRTLNLPFGLTSLPRWLRFIILSLIVLGLTLGAPIAYTLSQFGWQWSELILEPLGANISGWFSFAISGTVILAVIGIASEVTRASVEEVAPSHVTQFREIFDALVRGRKKYLIFVDELDRCDTDDVLRVLNGLRTFLGHKNCTFVAAFDRAAVAAAISTTIKANQPNRETGAYYSSAGEFLDKIFQYQVSLPPQTAHTFRRMALSLVAEKAGVWALLRSHLGRRMGDLVSLLSPIHIVSPRRTKVILNAFALNARSFESIFGTKWVERAMEIAVWTVIQTEFPQLAEDMIAEPDLPRYLVDRHAQPHRVALKEVVARYRKASVELDDIPSSADDEGKEEHRQLLLAQWKALEDYLYRLVSLRVSFPKPDIVLMARSPLAARFEDSGLYTAIVRAVDEVPSNTIDVLAAASDSDLIASIEYLCMEAEGLGSNEVRIIANVVGEAVSRIETSDAFVSSPLSALWRRADLGEDKIDWITAEALDGFVQRLASSDFPDYVAAILRRASRGGVKTDLATAMAIRSVPAKYLAKGLHQFNSSIFSGLDEGGSALAAAASRAGRESREWMNRETRSLLAETIRVPDPEDTVPTSGPSAVVAAEREVYELALSAAQERRDMRLEASLSALATAWDELLGVPDALEWIGCTILEIIPADDRAETVINELLEMLPEDFRIEISLRLMATNPLDLCERWSWEKLPEASIPTARQALERVAVEITSAAETNRSALLRAFSVLAPQVAPASPDTLNAILSFTSAIDMSSAVSEWTQAVDVLRDGRAAGLDQLALSSASTTLYLLFMQGEVAEAKNAAILQKLRSEDLGIQRLVRDELCASTGGVMPVMRARIVIAVANNEYLEFGRSPSIPLEVVREALPGDVGHEILAGWVKTGPRFDQLVRTADRLQLSALPAAAWRVFSLRAGERSRSDAWKFAWENNYDRARLVAIASSGVERPLYFQQAELIGDGPNAVERASLVDSFLTLPQGNRVAAEAAMLAVRRLSDALPQLRYGDGALVSRLLLPNADAYTTAELTQARQLTARWFSDFRRIASPSARRLISLNLL